mgnify:CR=1 FL=1
MKELQDGVVEFVETEIGAFVAEIRLMSSLDHPGIVRFYGVAFSPDHSKLYLIMVSTYPAWPPGFCSSPWVSVGNDAARKLTISTAEQSSANAF